MRGQLRSFFNAKCSRSPSEFIIRYHYGKASTAGTIPRLFHTSRQSFSRMSPEEETIAADMAPKPQLSAPSIPWSTGNKQESTAKSSMTGKPVPLPSPSASVILVSPSNKVLLLHRMQKSSSFPSAHVFPGGNMESSDGSLPQDPSDPKRHSDNLAYRTCAIRELFEESGILLARQSSSPSAPLLFLPKETRLRGRDAIHSGKITLKDWLRSQCPEAVPDTDGLTPFTRWITPTNVPKRFTTQMYIYFIPTGLKDEQRRSLIATGDEVETMAPQWKHASEWLTATRGDGTKKGIILFPPQYTLLSFVSDHLDGEGWQTANAQEVEARRERLLKFITTDGSPPWSEKVISPTALAMERADGRRVLRLDKPGPELKGTGIKGDDTRVVLVSFNKEGPRDVEVRFKKDVLEEEKQAAQREKGKEIKL